MSALIPCLACQEGRKRDGVNRLESLKQKNALQKREHRMRTSSRTFFVALERTSIRGTRRSLCRMMYKLSTSSLYQPNIFFELYDKYNHSCRADGRYRSDWYGAGNHTRRTHQDRNRSSSFAPKHSIFHPRCHGPRVPGVVKAVSYSDLSAMNTHIIRRSSTSWKSPRPTTRIVHGFRLLSCRMIISRGIVQIMFQEVLNATRSSTCFTVTQINSKIIVNGLRLQLLCLPHSDTRIAMSPCRADLACRV
ncbi:hypothetical protein APHAL10511_004616 [Amanita phalloides]|nr:hypothetical protein APHAL10511_004616 [Amanita phalloides]